MAFVDRVSGQIIALELHTDAPPNERQRLKLRVHYAYEVDGTQYVSNHVFAKPDSQLPAGTNSQQLLALLVDHPVGAPVTVYYDATAPLHACLEPECDLDTSAIDCWWA